jgi:hypothetical protein
MDTTLQTWTAVTPTATSNHLLSEDQPTSSQQTIISNLVSAVCIVVCGLVTVLEHSRTTQLLLETTA